MIYSNSTIRRHERSLEETAASKLLEMGEFGIVSMCCEEIGVYGVPMNYVWNAKDSIYLHCAAEGQKLNCIDENSLVSFCVVGKTKVVSEKFTSKYESIILQCVASRGLSDDERKLALGLILDKYSPHNKIEGVKLIEKTFSQTEIIRLDIKNWSGKCKT